MPSSAPRPVSQRQIATALGFSQSLVSRVLNGALAGIPDATAQKIWACARAQGYTPRGINLDLLVADRVATRMVGVVLRSPLRLTTESALFHHAHEGLHDFLRNRGVRTVFLGSEDEFDPAELRQMMAQHRLLLGLVVMGEVRRSFVEKLAPAPKPVVLVSARHTGLAHSVVSNLTQAADLLVGHLHGLGHRRFAWIGSSHSSQSMRRHKDAFAAALAARGLPLAPDCEFDQPESSRHCGHAAATTLLARHSRHRPTAVVCFNGMMARAALNAFSQHGLTVPRDLSVAAFDMTHVCVEEPPHLTSATASPEEFGRRAAELILARTTEGTDPGLCEIIVPATLAVRATTGPAPRAKKK